MDDKINNKCFPSLNHTQGFGNIINIYLLEKCETSVITLFHIIIKKGINNINYYKWF